MPLARMILAPSPHLPMRDMSIINLCSYGPKPLKTICIQLQRPVSQVLPELHRLRDEGKMTLGADGWRSI